MEYGLRPPSPVSVSTPFLRLNAGMRRALPLLSASCVCVYDNAAAAALLYCLAWQYLDYYPFNFYTEAPQQGGGGRVDAVTESWFCQQVWR